MFQRLIASFVLLWLAGFAWFAIALPQPLAGGKSDAAIVLTGGEGRIARALEALRKGSVSRVLVAGVDPEVKPREFAAQYRVSRAVMACCVTLGYQSFDTRSNGNEAARWITANHLRSVRLITTDWHMRRAAFELDRAKPAGVTVIHDAVASQPSLETLFTEYNKLLARLALALTGR